MVGKHPESHLLGLHLLAFSRESLLSGLDGGERVLMYECRNSCLELNWQLVTGGTLFQSYCASLSIRAAFTVF